MDEQNVRVQQSLESVHVQITFLQTEFEVLKHLVNDVARDIELPRNNFQIGGCKGVEGTLIEHKLLFLFMETDNGVVHKRVKKKLDLVY